MFEHAGRKRSYHRSFLAALFGRRQAVRRRQLGVELLEDRRVLSAGLSSPSGQPTVYEQYLLELLNRGRSDPLVEAARYGLSLNAGLSPGTISSTPKQPLALSPTLNAAARGHSQWMLDNDTFSHTGQGGSDPGQRMVAAGYLFVAPWSLGENIGWKGTSGTFAMTDYVDHIHAELFESPPHRVNQMNGVFREVGLGAVPGSFAPRGSAWNSLVVTEKFALSGGTVFLTGVVYDDALVLADQFYTPGEGLGGVTITAVRHWDGQVFSTQTWASGGYSLPLPGGIYSVTALGGPWGTALVQTNVSVGSQNVKLDFTPADNAAPVVSMLTATPSSVTRPGLLTLSAEGVSDPDGQVVEVRFYRDSNANGIWEPTDELLGADQQASGGWSWTGGTAGWPVGDHAVFARALGDSGTWSEMVSTTATVLNAVPTVAALSATPDSFFRPAEITLTASGVTDADGAVVQVEFYRGDEWLGGDDNGGDGWTWTGSTAGWPAGPQALLARAKDNDGAWSPMVGATVTVHNASPMVAGLSAVPIEVVQSEQITLVADGVTDPDGTVAFVEFFHHGVLLGVDDSGNWRWTGNTAGWPVGEHGFSARAGDNDGASSPLVIAAATVVAELAPVDFGVVPVFAARQRTWTLANDGTNPMVVRASDLGFPFAIDPTEHSPGPGAWIIAPGASASFLVSYRPTEEGPHQAALPMTGDAAGRQVRISGRGLAGWQNTANPFDVDGNGNVSAQDVLLLINEINRNGTGTLPQRTAEQPGPPLFLDPTGDGNLTAADVLLVINFINRGGPGTAEGEFDRVFHRLGAGFSSSDITERSTEVVTPAPSTSENGNGLSFTGWDKDDRKHFAWMNYRRQDERERGELRFTTETPMQARTGLDLCGSDESYDWLAALTLPAGGIADDPFAQDFYEWM